MHRNALLEMLYRYRERWPDEDAGHRFECFVRRQPRCFERDCWDDGHVTASAALLDPRREAMLMTLHAKLGRWLQLGGHADGETDALAVACREAAEESGLEVAPASPEPIDVDIHAIPPHGSDPAHFHYDVRFVLLAEAGTPKTTEESLGLKWVPLAGMAALTAEESILRLSAKCRAWLALFERLKTRPNAARQTRR